MNRFARYPLTPAAFALASLILAYEPLKWLLGSWIDPSYQSTGALYLLAIVLLLSWSLSSPVKPTVTSARPAAVALLALAAVIRFLSQILAINVIGGMALAIDIFAIATLLRSGDRARPLSPFWLSVLFLFTLPVERILQRLAGYPLQEASAKLACGALDLFVSDLTCSGIRIGLAGKDVLVDLPCSGTAGLMLVMAFFVILNTLYRPRLPETLLWFVGTLALGLIGNAVRVCLIAVGIAWPEVFFGLDVMAQPLHDVVGYLTLALSLAPLLAFYKPRKSLPVLRIPGRWSLMLQDRYLCRVSAVVFLIFALFVIGLPRSAFDVSKATPSKPLPLILGGEVGVDQNLLPLERAYFEQYGGHAQKRRYGALALTLVHTTSPLRHLHAPDDCLRGLGYQVSFLGSRFDPIPTAIYRARSPSGAEWQVAVTFVSASGLATNNIAEVIWRWLKTPGTSWTSIQRITPWKLPETERMAMEASVVAALDLPAQTPQ